MEIPLPSRDSVEERDVVFKDNVSVGAVTRVGVFSCNVIGLGGGRYSHKYDESAPVVYLREMPGDVLQVVAASEAFLREYHNARERAEGLVATAERVEG